MLPVVAVVSAWLLLAEPQSSSTSTMMELAEMANLLGTQEYPCRGVMHQTTYGCWEDGCYPRDHIFYPLLTHSDVCEIIPLFIDKYISSKKIIYKNHITPTEHNKKWVLTYARRSQKPVVILTRDVYDAVHGFCERWLREGQLGVGGQHVIKNRTVELHETLASFQAWSDGWTAFARAHPKHARVITFEAMMAGGQREAVLSSALEFWGIRKVRSMSGVMARYVHAETSRCDGIRVSSRRTPTPAVPSTSGMLLSGRWGGRWHAAEEQLHALRMRVNRTVRVAVVGSSGNLLSRGHGAAIDAHDLVIRVNDAVVRGFEADVGSRTDLRVTWEKGLIRGLQRGSVSPDDPMVLTRPSKHRPPWALVSQLLKLTHQPRGVKSERIDSRDHRRCPTCSRTSVVQRLLDEQHSADKKANGSSLVAVIDNEVWPVRLHEEQLEKQGKYPSTGFQAMAMAVALTHLAGAPPPSVFGFGACMHAHRL
jgi:hypothetical protein